MKGSSQQVVKGISLLLIVLWVYAAVNKLQDVALFEEQLQRQPFPVGTASWLAWVLPLVELGAANLLLFRPWRGWGLLLSFLLLLLFTGYVALAVLGLWEELPCACGGVLSRLGWREHLVFNLGYTVLNGAGLWLWMIRKGRGRSGRAASSGEAAYRSGRT